MIKDHRETPIRLTSLKVIFARFFRYFLSFSYSFTMQSKCAEHISFCAKGVAVMGNLSLEPEHHVKVLSEVQISLFSIPERTLYH